MLAWIINNNLCVYMLLMGAMFLQITTDANPTEIPYEVCATKVINVGTRIGKDDDKASCYGCDSLRNCTSVFGSVHLKGIFLNNKRNEHLQKELRFPHLREITGHLIVTFVDDVTSLSDILPNLAVIHGRVEQQFQGYALVVYRNKGLQNLGLNSLTLIKRGGIKIEFNQKLCYLDYIRWQSLRDYGEGKKYDLAMNGNSNECFAKCSEFCNTPSGHGSSGHKYCWGRGTKNCQKLCHSKCGSSGCEVGSQDKCCHKECLGGCTKANSPFHCNACQNLRLQNGSCVAFCPPGLKEVGQFACHKKCPGDVKYEVNGKCYANCPAGYKENKIEKNTCEKCDDCRRECRSREKIRTLSDSAELKGCDVVIGGLEIEMTNVPGSNIATYLSDHLGSLKEIHGYLVVRKSTPLISLNFFKNLMKIVPSRRGYAGYGVFIFDNPNLESLWDFHPNFEITGSSKIFVQLNPRLCLHNVYPLIDNILKLNRSDPDVAISEATNGNANTCNVRLVNITIAPTKCSAIEKDLCVKVFWRNEDTKADYRDVLLYSVWYRETKTTDLSEYDDIDACTSDQKWTRKDVEALFLRGPDISIRISGLSAFTLYAFRVESIVIAGAAIKSSISYFKTKSTKPSVPRNLDVSFLSSSSLQVKWEKPFFPNGEITHYVVKYLESDSSYLWKINIDWCKNIDSSLNFYEKKEENNEGTSLNNSCSVNVTCDCENGNTKQITPDLKEAIFAKEFEDKIINAVFVKNDDKNTKDDTIVPTPTLPNRNVTSTISQGCNNRSKNSSCSNKSSTSTSKPTTFISTLPLTTAPPVITRNTTSQTIILTGLKYFTDYSVEVCACNAGAGCGENRFLITQCSTTIGRTGKNDTADNVGNSLKVTANNLTRKFTLDWKAPVSPNGVVLRYYIWIRFVNLKENITRTEKPCVLAPETEYTRDEAYFGDYTARVRAITPVGNGSWSNDVTFKIAEQAVPPAIQAAREDDNIVTVVGVSTAAVCVAIIVFAVLTYSVIQRQKKKTGAGVLFSSTNPEYWNCSEVYVPDEWEVPRKDITLIRELGNGSFGMVWEGEAVGILPGVDSCKVAVKTVSDHSSIRDKVEFLKEASIMKAFNCNHVLRLLGVVSAGDPVLVIMELMENGDLKSFLRRRRPDAEEEPFLPPPTDIELYQMAAEIADGMAYLADRKFVHRDLAARNCMVSANYTCKIGDFGMARDVYETDYYRKGGKGFLPVRWMAPESLKDGVFCSASDVWSYGVVLWEMVTLAEQPYQGKSNEEVMKYVLDGNIMEIPESCPRKLLEIILLCWQYKSKLRLSFLSIVENLQGYLPIEFTERSFYHNERPRKETETSSLVSLGTEHDNLSELPDVLTDPIKDDPAPKESFV